MHAILRILLSVFCFTYLSALAHPQDVKKPPSGMWGDAPETEADSGLDRLNRAFIRLAETTRPAIVQIRVNGDLASVRNDSQSPQGSRGSGFIVQPSGYVLTAQHVIEKAKEIEV